MFHLNPTEVCKRGGLWWWRACVTLALTVSGLAKGASLPAPQPNPPAVESLELVWDPVPDDGIVGYRVYIGTESGQYTRILETDSEPAQTVSGLERGLTYYFAVSAFNDLGLESELSVELVVTIDTPPLPMGAVVLNDTAGGGRLELRWSFPRSALGSSPEIVIQESGDLIHWSEAAVVWSGDFTGESDEDVTFDWAIPTEEETRFYRLTARNWLGESVLR